MSLIEVKFTIKCNYCNNIIRFISNDETASYNNIAHLINQSVEWTHTYISYIGVGDVCDLCINHHLCHSRYIKSIYGYFGTNNELTFLSWQVNRAWDNSEYSDYKRHSDYRLVPDAEEGCTGFRIYVAA